MTTTRGQQVNKGYPFLFLTFASCFSWEFLCLDTRCYHQWPFASTAAWPQGAFRPPKLLTWKVDKIQRALMQSCSESCGLWGKLLAWIWGFVWICGTFFFFFFLGGLMLERRPPAKKSEQKTSLVLSGSTFASDLCSNCRNDVEWFWDDPVDLVLAHWQDKTVQPLKTFDGQEGLSC